MRSDQVFGFLLILLAIYLGVNATARGDAGDDLFADIATDDPPVIVDDDGGKMADDPDKDRDPDKDKDKYHDDGNEGVVSTSDFCAGVSEVSRFDDLGDKHDEAVRCMDAAGVVEGVSADTYAPRDALTRAQAASTIAAMIDASNRLEREGVDLRALPEAPDVRFVDVEPDHPDADDIGRLNEARILEGYVDARYEPDGRVSRGQMASILDRAYKYMTGEAFPAANDQFDDDERSVHQDSIDAVAEANIMDGRGNRRFAPKDAVRRGPMATYAARTMIRLEETGRIRPLD